MFFFKLKVLIVVFFAFLGLVAFSFPSAYAFDSRGPGILGISFGESIHEEITQEALEKLGIKHGAIELIEDANTDIDFDEFLHKETYAPQHHFDRGPDKTNEQAFMDGSKYVNEQMEEAMKYLKNREEVGRSQIGEAYEAMGQGLHALQDFFSHSNYGDLSDGDKEKALAALLDPKKTPPANLKLTGYDPKADDPSNPPGDGYPHEKYNKDKPGSTKDSEEKINGNTKFDLAREAAVEATKEFVEKMKEKLKKEVGEIEDNKLWRDCFLCRNEGSDPPIYQNVMVFATPERFLSSDLNDDGDTSISAS